jgi:hypothetical protein
MYYGQTKKFIRYPMWSWDKIQCLLVCIKACESQWYDNKVAFASIFLCLSHLHYLENYVYKSIIDHAIINRDVQRIM